MGDDRLDVLKRRIGGGRRVGKYRGGIKNIEALILHRPHIKVIDRNDHENIQVVLAPIDFFVPTHRLLKRCHRVRAFVGVLVLDEYLQRHGAPAARHKTVLDHAQRAGHKRKQIGRLYKRVMPYHSVPPIAQNLTRGWISIRQEHRVTLRIGDNLGGEF